MNAACFVLLSLLHVTKQDRFFYLRSLPNATFEGILSQADMYKTIEANSAMHCATQWKDNPPLGFNYDPDTRRCTPYDQIHGIKNSTSVKGHFIQVQTQEGCTVGDAHQMLPELLSCREGWEQINVSAPTASSYCYRVIDTQGKPPMNIISLCKKTFPYSHAASIHSHEEEKQIAELFTRPDLSGWQGVRFGLELPNIAMGSDYSTSRWVDGSPMDYKNIKHETGGKCDARCSNGVFSWEPSTSTYKWTRPNVAFIDKCPLLCKYKLK